MVNTRWGRYNKQCLNKFTVIATVDLTEAHEM